MAYKVSEGNIKSVFEKHVPSHARANMSEEVIDINCKQATGVLCSQSKARGGRGQGE